MKLPESLAPHTAGTGVLAANLQAIAAREHRPTGLFTAAVGGLLNFFRN
ncbi:hypothetical protein JZY06_09700 [Corynebacterium sp. CCM 8862]|uniref:Uncharacterized protein n=1 Tax=Corynebacterium mendelii TaxID=2765362 RepID=A0A939E392_9CORY|nr:hypothetical protein [Corynebacterium mendelii]MBN9644881.1 hypothetical protein [Corynebacterium mendelii]